MMKPVLLGAASLLLTACASEPKSVADVNPILILDANNGRYVTTTKTTDQTHQVTYLTVTQSQYAQSPDNAKPTLGFYVEQPRQFVFHYPTNGTTASFSQMQPVLSAAKTACRIDINGRTDGQKVTTGEKQIAQKRASYVRDQLVKYGVTPERIFTNYSPSTDYVGDNWTEDGRAQNRRVEINVYTACR